MEVLVLDGKNYVKASKAAKELGYATDYVGQLCRGGHVDAHLIGRTWYVNQEELSTHRVKKKRNAREKAREYAKKAIEENRAKIVEPKTQNNYKSLDIQYESDPQELIPPTRKISVVSTPVTKPKSFDEGVANYSYENSGKKIIMSGDLDVVDVTDGPVDTDTIFLTPRIQKHTALPKKEEVVSRKSFIERLEEPVVAEEKVTIQETVIDDEAPVADELSVEDETLDTTELSDESQNLTVSDSDTEDLQTNIQKDTGKKASVLPYAFIVVILVLVVMPTIGVSKKTVYTDEEKNFSTTYIFDIKEQISILRSKI